MRAGPFEVLNKIFSTIFSGANAWNFIFNVSIHGESTFDYLCISIENNFFFLISTITDDKHAIIP